MVPVWLLLAVGLAIAEEETVNPMGEPEEVASAIAFLASDAADGYHGACISIDKGITAG